MSFRGRVTRMLRTVRADGSTAVDIGNFQPVDGASAYPASVTLWNAAGDQFAAFAMQDGRNPVAYLGLGKRADNRWVPSVKLYNGGGVSILADRSIVPAVVDFTDLDPLSKQVTGQTVIGFNDLHTGAVRAPGSGVPLELDGSGLPIKVTGTLAGPAWVRPALGSSWANYGSGYAPFGYRQLPDGSVMLEGMIAGGLTGAANPVITLPVALRPTAHQWFLTAASSGAADIRIFSTGVVSVYGFVAGGNNAAVSFGGVRFMPAGL